MVHPRLPDTERTIPWGHPQPISHAGWPKPTGAFPCDACGAEPYRPKAEDWSKVRPHPTVPDPDRWGAVLHVCRRCTRLGLTRRQLRDLVERRRLYLAAHPELAT